MNPLYLIWALIAVGWPVAGLLMKGTRTTGELLSMAAPLPLGVFHLLFIRHFLALDRTSQGAQVKPEAQ